MGHRGTQATPPRQGVVKGVEKCKEVMQGSVLSSLLFAFVRDYVMKKSVGEGVEGIESMVARQDDSRLTLYTVRLTQCTVYS